MFVQAFFFCLLGSPLSGPKPEAATPSRLLAWCTIVTSRAEDDVSNPFFFIEDHLISLWGSQALSYVFNSADVTTSTKALEIYAKLLKPCSMDIVVRLIETLAASLDHYQAVSALSKAIGTSSPPAPLPLHLPPQGPLVLPRVLTNEQPLPPFVLPARESAFCPFFGETIQRTCTPWPVPPIHFSVTHVFFVVAKKTVNAASLESILPYGDTDPTLFRTRVSKTTEILTSLLPHIQEYQTVLVQLFWVCYTVTSNPTPFFAFAVTAWTDRLLVRASPVHAKFVQFVTCFSIPSTLHSFCCEQED